MLAWLAVIGLEPTVPVQRPKSMQPVVPAEPEPAEPEPIAPEPEPTSPDPVEPEPSEVAEATSTEPAPAEACPCDPIDWRCREENRDACPAIETPPPLEVEEAPIERARDEDDEPAPPSSFNRRGIALAPAIGIGGCANDWCDGYRVGVWGQAEIGYRFGIITPLLGFGGGRGPFDTAALSRELEIPFSKDDASISFLDLGAGLLLFPIRTGRLDPFFGARIGYHRAKLKAETADGLRATETISRGGVRIGGGLSVFVAESIEIGPRFDITVPFAGEVCANVSYMSLSDSRCVAVKNLEEEARVDSTELALPWSILFEVRAVLGVR
jgi:hypothetical protein